MYTQHLSNFTNPKFQTFTSYFYKVRIRASEEITAIFGPEVTFHSMDDNAITIAKKQNPLLMHMEYHVSLPDHDFVVGSKHKLIQSIIGDISH